MELCSKLLKSWRAKKGLSIKEFARKLGVGETTYNSWELNISRCRLDKLIEIITLLEGNMREFLFAYEQDKYSQCKQTSKELK